MKIIQPRKHSISLDQVKEKTVKKQNKGHRKRHTANEGLYGTSKLETYFAKNFLDKIGVKYVYEWEAKDIKRFYDFAIVAVAEENYAFEEKNGIISISQSRNNVRPCLIVEIDGSYYHGDPRVVDESNLNSMQKKNKIIDEYKDDWCRVHHIPILRIWEYDIMKNPAIVMETLLNALNRLDISDKKKLKKKK